MSYLITNQQKLNDIIFANRNKNYGAYALRSSYGSTMLKSLSFMIFGFGTFISIAYYLSNKPVLVKDVAGQVPDLIYTVPVDLEKKIKPEEPAARKPAQKEPDNQSKAASTSLTISDSVDTRKVSTELLQSTVPSSVGIISFAKEPGTGEVEKKPVVPGNGTTTVVRGNFEVDSQPEFEGGLAALYKFLSSRLRYPEPALDRGIQGTVFVKFVVDEKGKVGSLSLVNNLGYGLDDEAVRVVSMIPDFKTPAKIGGEAVKVYYQLPIKFKYK